jgi:hypothetical protein
MVELYTGKRGCEMRGLLCFLMCVSIGQAAGKLLPPRGLKPMVALRPEGTDGPHLQIRAELAGRPLENFVLRVRASRTSKQELWSGVSDSSGLLRVLLPAESANKRLAMHGHAHGVRMPVWSQLSWKSSQEFGVHGDSTGQISTASLNMWELRAGDAHVYFAWPQREEAETLLAELLKQRRRVSRFLGVRLEPMGAVFATREGDLEVFRTMTGTHMMRHGQWIHGIRSWPLFAGSLAEIADDFTEDRELAITLPHELAENSLLFAESAGLAHEGTRWFRDGVAESAAAFCAWDRPKLLAEHLRTRLNDLEKNDEKVLNLLEWKQDSNAGTLARYAAATAWVLAAERKQGGLIATVTSQAEAADQMDSDGLVSALSRETGRDCQAELSAVQRDAAAAILKETIGDLEKRSTWATQ